jgi:hypothetical protein
MNIRFGATDAPFFRTSGTKKTHPNFNHLPSILGVKWGGGMEKCEKKAQMLEYLGSYTDIEVRS